VLYKCNPFTIDHLVFNKQFGPSVVSCVCVCVCVCVRYSSSDDEDNDPEEMFQNIQYQKEIIANIRTRPWPMRRKLKVLKYTQHTLVVVLSCTLYYLVRSFVFVFYIFVLSYSHSVFSFFHPFHFISVFLFVCSSHIFLRSSLVSCLPIVDSFVIFTHTHTHTHTHTIQRKTTMVNDSALTLWCNRPLYRADITTWIIALLKRHCVPFCTHFHS